ncbi:MAG TPA: SIMPL domain-containing protein [Gemmatimonadaceae bacterium]|jgi:uncharacterized protein YggE|nr:SIMPL domain-containing protein [Gemmatimonadaceae bacterium]
MRWVLLAAALMTANSLTAQTPATQSQPVVPQISTSATGEARVQPDRATILFAVETRASTAARAGADNAQRQRAVLDTLRKSGLAEGQLSTTGYSVTPEMRHDGKESRVIGYVARNMVQAEVRRIDQVGTLIDAALGAGANVVSSLRFHSSRADEARRLALADAVSKARADAEAIARAAGGSLGELIEISTSGPVRPFYGEDMAVRATAADTTTPIDPGEQTITVFVSARWRFVGASR